MIYNFAADILRNIAEHKGSLKTLIFTSNYKNKKSLYAIVCETLKTQKILDHIIRKTNISSCNSALRDEWLLRVIIYEQIFGKSLKEPWKSRISKYKSCLNAELARLKIQHKVATNSALCSAVCGLKDRQLPRYVRVNTLKASLSGVINCLQNDGYLQRFHNASYNSFLDVARSLEPNEFLLDMTIPNLLVFAFGTDFHEHELYLSGQIILQDKASCLPAHVLACLGLTEGSGLLDCCAAPGNKTSHAAALMHNKGKIMAVEKNQQRMKTLKKMLKQASATCVHCVREDFLLVDSKDSDYRNLEFAIVDPSCTGSGFTDRPNICTKEENLPDRLAKLASFQQSILHHAMSFPSIHTIVYSTCSIHEEENEQVVEKVLSNCGGMFQVVNILADFPSRGLSKYLCGQNCLRLSSQNDLTTGFFVACFQRTDMQLSGQKTSPINYRTLKCDVSVTNDPDSQEGSGEKLAVNKYLKDRQQQAKRKTKVYKTLHGHVVKDTTNSQQSPQCSKKKSKKRKGHKVNRPVTV